MNKIFIKGNLTQDLELKTVNDKKLCVMTVADGNGDKVNFFEVKAWNKLAESCVAYLKKGSSVFVEGGVDIQEFEKKDGSKGKHITINAQNISFLDTKKNKKG